MHFLLLALSRLFNQLPHAVAVRLGRSLGDIWYFGVRFRREVVESNLRLAFGERSDLDTICRDNIRHYGQLLVEFIRSYAWTRKDYIRNVTVEGYEHIAPLLHSGTGGFLLSGHIGNWEIAIGAAAAAGIPVDVIVKHARSPQLEKILQWYRRKTGFGVFLEEGTAREIVGSIAKGSFVPTARRNGVSGWRNAAAIALASSVSLARPSANRF